VRTVVRAPPDVWSTLSVRPRVDHPLEDSSRHQRRRIRRWRASPPRRLTTTNGCRVSRWRSTCASAVRSVRRRITRGPGLPCKRSRRADAVPALAEANFPASGAEVRLFEIWRTGRASRRSLPRKFCCSIERRSNPSDADLQHGTSLLVRCSSSRSSVWSCNNLQPAAKPEKDRQADDHGDHGRRSVVGQRTTECHVRIFGTGPWFAAVRGAMYTRKRG